jgi:short-subunit dehydrogenase
MVDIDRSVIDVAFHHSESPLFGSSGEGGGQTRPQARTAPRSAGGGFEGRLAVITGASGLLGSALASGLIARGASVCLIGRDLESLRATRQEFGPGAGTALLRCDLASAEDVASASDFIDRIGRPVDLLVHAAGLFTPSSIATGAVADLDEHYLLDVRGPYLLTKRLMPSLAEAEGRVVFFAGLADSTPAPREHARDVHRDVTLAGLRSFATALRDESTPRGVRVLTVRTDEVVETTAATSDTGFAADCASTVLDLLAVESLDVTGVELRRGGCRARSEQR